MIIRNAYNVETCTLIPLTTWAQYRSPPKKETPVGHRLIDNLPGNLKHENHVFSLISTSRRAVYVDFRETTCVGVTMAPTAQTTGLHPRRTDPGGESLKPSTHSM